MLSHLAMRASLVTDLARLGRVSRPAHAPMRRVAAFASWRMGGGGDEGSDDAPPPARRRATTSAPQARKRFDDDDAYAEDYGNDGEAQTVGFAARRQGAGGRGGRGRGGGSRGNASRGNARGDRGRGRSFDERGDRYRPGFEDDDGFGGPTTRSVWQDRHDEKKRVREETGRSTLAETLVGEAVFGLNPVREALLAKRRQIHKVWVQEGADGILGDRQILSGCDELGLQITTVSKHDLNMLVNQGGGSGRPHNGVVIDASALEPVPIDSLPKWNPPSPSSEGKKKKKPPIWLALDEVVDPQNLGAILRTAKFLGVSGVVVCAKNSAPLSPVVSKASSGALESFPIKSVGVMHRFLQRCAEDGWDVFGASGGDRGAEDVTAIHKIDKPSVLVMGNEGAGLRTNVRRACTRTIEVAKMNGIGNDDATDETSVDSLNVSVATGIILHALLSAARRE